jgi:hypothetical protein
LTGKDGKLYCTEMGETYQVGNIMECVNSYKNIIENSNTLNVKKLSCKKLMASKIIIK